MDIKMKERIKFYLIVTALCLPSASILTVTIIAHAAPPDTGYNSPNSFRQATVTRVIDGDTVVVAVVLGEGISLTDSIRLNGINAPDPGKDGKPATAASRAHLVDLLVRLGTKNGDGNAVIVVELMGRDKYGRLLGNLWGFAPDTGASVNICQQMVRDLFAKPWDGEGPKP